jgi:hypothetical protein
MLVLFGFVFSWIRGASATKLAGFASKPYKLEFG